MTTDPLASSRLVGRDFAYAYDPTRSGGKGGYALLSWVVLEVARFSVISRSTMRGSGVLAVG